VAAYHLLARVYQRSGQHDALIDTYRRHIAATNDRAARVELHFALGQVSQGSLQIEAYEDVLALDEHHAAALEALGQLYETAGEWERAVDALIRFVDVCDEAREPDVCLRIGRIQYRQLGETGSAEATLLRGLATDPGHLPSLEILTALYADRGDWLKAAQTMVRAESHARLLVDKTRLL